MTQNLVAWSQNVLGSMQPGEVCNMHRRAYVRSSNVARELDNELEDAGQLDADGEGEEGNLASTLYARVSIESLCLGCKEGRCGSH